MIKTIVCKITSLKVSNITNFPSPDDFTKIRWHEAVDENYKRFQGRLLSVTSTSDSFIIFDDSLPKNSIYYQLDSFDESGGPLKKEENFRKRILAFNGKVISDEPFELDKFEIFTPKRTFLDFKVDDFIIVMQIEFIPK